jgi:thiol-disulfide isomerase/thioredoxin
MKKFIIAAAMQLASVLPSSAKDGYHITVKMPDVKDSMVYLIHYYGQNRPHLYVSDSTRFDKNGVAVFNNKDAAFVGGIYIVLVKDTGKTNFELLLNKGDEFTVTAYKSKLPEDIKFKGSPENDRFEEYQTFIKGYAATQQKLEEEYKHAATHSDTVSVRERAVASGKGRQKYMRDYELQYPHTLLAGVFNAMESPELPEGPHYLEDGVTKDSTFAYRYYKTHYWDKFDFRDDRLIYTPVYDGKIDEYMNKLVLPWPDSVEKECDALLHRAKGTKDMFHYTLFWLTHFAEDSKVMGMDEVFVYLVENYYMKGDAFWLSNEELAKYEERARAIAPNVIGNVAPEVKLQSVITKKEESMQGLKAKYTLLVFYSPNCGHCQHEIPLLDSAYEATLKDKGVRVYTVATEGDEKAVTDFLVKNKIDKEWIDTWDPDHASDCKSKFDVYSTPTIYLMDDKKIIRGKRLDHSNIGSVIDMLEKKKAMAKK